jgi:hypothetical protein
MVIIDELGEKYATLWKELGMFSHIKEMDSYKIEQENGTTNDIILKTLKLMVEVHEDRCEW